MGKDVMHNIYSNMFVERELSNLLKEFEKDYPITTIVHKLLQIQQSRPQRTINLTIALTRDYFYELHER